MVGQNERSTDSRIKTGIQNILGGMVLLSLPVVAISIIGMWGTLGVHTVQLKHQSRDYTALLSRLMQLEGFKSRTESNRFRASDGERLEKKISRLDEARHDHDTKAERWITIIKRNTEIIKENQRKAHTHQWRENSK